MSSGTFNIYASKPAAHRPDFVSDPLAADPALPASPLPFFAQMAPGGRHDHLIEELEDLFQICFAQTRAPSTNHPTHELGLDLTKTQLSFWSKLRFNENQNALFPQEAWLTEGSKALKGDMQAAGNQQAELCIALASAPSIAAKMLEEAVIRCDQHGMLNLDFGICTPSEKMKICSASREL